MWLFNLSWRSLWHRRVTSILTLLTIAISVALFLGVESVRTGAKSSFANTLSGTDLVIGARSSPVQLMLYSVFRLGDATNNMSWKSYEVIANHPRIDWAVPISLGDSHKGYKVLGTNEDYFKHYKYGRLKPLVFAEGDVFGQHFDVVLGAEVAKSLGYSLGDEIIVSHGTGKTSFTQHDEFPFKIKGILKPTGTPVDRTVHVTLLALDIIHEGLVPKNPNRTSDEDGEIKPVSITAALVGLKSKASTFHVQRAVNQYPREALSAVLPGVALSQLWSMMGMAEKALLIVSAAVVFSGLVGMLAVLLSSLNERRRELAILRATGASVWQIFALVLLESLFLTLVGATLGVVLMYISIFASAPIVEEVWGIALEIAPLSVYQWQLLGSIVLAGGLVGCVPAYRAYRHSLSDGMTVKY